MNFAFGMLMLVALFAGCVRSIPLAQTDGFPTDDRQATTGRPQTIPALRTWLPAEGYFSLNKTSRVLVASGDGGALDDTAKLFVEDLKFLPGLSIGISNDGSDEVRPGDILLKIVPPDRELGSEGYELNVGSSIAITASTATGIFYGTRTLLQLFHQGATVRAGRARDWPRYPERGMMVDNARKYFTPRWFEQHIRELAYLKMNYLHLHFSDNEGFGIQSECHPKIVSKDHLSKCEVRGLLDLARRYHVIVVPEIDMPGHMGAVLAQYPNYQLRNMVGVPNPNVLDVTNPEAVRFAFDLIKEYLDLFPGHYWHAGADEVLPAAVYPLYPDLQRFAQKWYGPRANGKDAIHGFVNAIDEFVRLQGRTMRVWNDDLGAGRRVPIRPDIIVEWWTDFSLLSDWAPPNPRQLVEDGHQIMNCGWWPTYYVPGAIVPPKPNMAAAYQKWAVNNFYGDRYLNSTIQVPPHTISASESANLGAKLQIWMDHPAAETETQIATRIFERLRIIAQKTWESESPTQTHQEFLVLINAIGSEPRFQSPPQKIPCICVQNNSEM